MPAQQPAQQPTRLSDLLIQAPTEATRNVMRANRSRNTGPELALRRELHAMGLRYRVHHRVPVLTRRTIDIAFTRIRLAVFVDGCFWHGCPEHGTRPKSNIQYWSRKIEVNRARDASTDEHLTALGWTVLRLWEHESLPRATEVVVSTIEMLRVTPCS